LAVPMLKL